jgi:hypothetical protein
MKSIALIVILIVLAVGCFWYAGRESGAPPEGTPCGKGEYVESIDHGIITIRVDSTHTAFVTLADWPIYRDGGVKALAKVERARLLKEAGHPADEHHEEPTRHE